MTMETNQTAPCDMPTDRPNTRHLGALGVHRAAARHGPRQSSKRCGRSAKAPRNTACRRPSTDPAPAVSGTAYINLRSRQKRDAGRRCGDRLSPFAGLRSWFIGTSRHLTSRLLVARLYQPSSIIQHTLRRGGCSRVPGMTGDASGRSSVARHRVRSGLTAGTSGTGGAS